MDTNLQVATRAVRGMLEKHKTEIAHALPRHMTPDRMTRIALTEFRKNPKLAECDPASVCAAVVQAAQLGLEPGILGQSFLVPYGKECQLVPGWMGLIDLVSRTGRASVWTGAVFDDDLFEYSRGDKPFIRHMDGPQSGVGDPIAVYAVGRVNGAEWPIIDVWSRVGAAFELMQGRGQRE